MLVALLGVAGYLLPDLYITAKKRTVQTERVLKLQNVAFNLKEVGKLLLFYERMIYTKDPLSLDPRKPRDDRVCLVNRINQLILNTTEIVPQRLLAEKDCSGRLD